MGLRFIAFISCNFFKLFIQNIDDTKVLTWVEQFVAKRCAEILIHKGLQKPQASRMDTEEFRRILDVKEIGANRVKNRLIQVLQKEVPNDT